MLSGKHGRVCTVKHVNFLTRSKKRHGIHAVRGAVYDRSDANHPWSQRNNRDHQHNWDWNDSTQFTVGHW